MIAHDFNIFGAGVCVYTGGHTLREEAKKSQDHFMWKRNEPSGLDVEGGLFVGSRGKSMSIAPAAFVHNVEIHAPSARLDH